MLLKVEWLAFHLYAHSGVLMCLWCRVPCLKGCRQLELVGIETLTSHLPSMCPSTRNALMTLHRNPKTPPKPPNGRSLPGYSSHMSQHQESSYDFSPKPRNPETNPCLARASMCPRTRNVLMTLTPSRNPETPKPRNETGCRVIVF